MTTDNSVLQALDELRQLENDREKRDVQAKKTAAEQALRALAMEAAEAEALAAAEAKRRRSARELTAAKARLALEVETGANEAKDEVAALKQRLLVVQAERRLLNDRMLASVGGETAEGPKRNGWPLAFAAVSAFAMMLGAALLLRSPTIEIHEVMVPTPVLAVAEAPAAELEPVQTTPVVDETNAAAEEAEPQVRANRPRPRPHVRPRPRPPARRDGLSNLDGCGDDPLCGL